MGKKCSFLKSTIVYFLGNVLTKLMTFFLLPVYTIYFQTEEIGFYEASASFITFFAMTAFLNIWAAVLRFMFDYQEKKDKIKAIHNGLFITFLSLFLYTAAFCVFLLFRPLDYAVYIYFYGLFTVLHYLYGNLARGFEKNVLYAVTGVLASLVTLLSNIVLIVYFRLGVASLYISVVLGYILQILLVEIRLKVLRNFRMHSISRSLLRSYFYFCLPISISTLISWFLDGYNKTYISDHLGYAENGLYSVAGKFSGALSLITSVIILAWQEMAFRHADTEDVHAKNNTYTHAVNTYLYYMLFGVAVLLPLITIVFPLLIKEDFRSAYAFIPFHLLGVALSTFMNFYSQIFFADKKTISVTLSFALSALANFCLLNIFVPRWGIAGANYSVIVSYLLGLALMFLISRKNVRVKLASYKNIFSFALLLLSILIYQYNNMLYAFAFLAVDGFCFLLLERKNLLLIWQAIRQRRRSY